MKHPEKKAEQMTQEELASYIDYSVLKPEFTEEEIIELSERERVFLLRFKRKMAFGRMARRPAGCHSMMNQPLRCSVLRNALKKNGHGSMGLIVRYIIYAVAAFMVLNQLGIVWCPPGQQASHPGRKQQ